MLTLKHAVEALVFASPRPLTIPEIVKAVRGAAVESEDPAVQQLGETGDAGVAAALEDLKVEYIRQERAFQIVEQVSGWAMGTVKEAADWVRQLYPEARPTRLSGPALETLAIIAYRQPVTRADIEAVRGVAVDGVMQVLLDRALVKIAGRAELPGRPLLYETTEYFLQHFGLKTTDELPNVDELRRVALPKAEVPAAVEKPAAAPEEPAAAPEEPAAAPEEPADAPDAPVESPAEPQPAPEN
jgi:segregation and condensation protein B